MSVNCAEGSSMISKPLSRSDRLAITWPTELALSMLLIMFGLTSAGALAPLLMPRPSPPDRLPISLRLKVGSSPDSGSTKRCRSLIEASLRLAVEIG
ncbi:hypothetical protein D3C75_1047190 [compost metagenome]